MGFLKHVFSFFGNTFLFLAIFIIFTTLSLQYAIEDISVISESIEKNLPVVLKENKGLLVDSIMNNAMINKAQILRVCTSRPEELPRSFCAALNGMSEERAKQAYAEIVADKLGEELSDPSKAQVLVSQFKDVEESIKETINTLKFMVYFNYVILAGILIFLLGSLLIFLAEKFEWRSAVYRISLRTGVLTGLATVMNYLTKDLTPGQLENMMNSVPALSNKGADFGIKLMSAVMLDWIKVISAKMFIVTLVAAIVSLPTAIVMFILKRRKAKAEGKKPEEAKKEIKKKEEAKEPGKVEEKAKAPEIPQPKKAEKKTKKSSKKNKKV